MCIYAVIDLDAVDAFYTASCSKLWSTLLFNQDMHAQEHGVYLLNYFHLFSYKQAVLGHTVTVAVALCSGPPEYT